LRLSRRGFTLIEVMIALVIISIALVALSTSQGIALLSTRKSKFVTLATVAAKGMMSEVDILSTLKGFTYVKELGEKTEGEFDSPEYKDWKWVREVKEVNFPIAAIMKSYMGGGGAAPPTEGDNTSSLATTPENKQNNSQEAQLLNMVTTNVETFMKQSVREVTITVMWPVRGGQEFSNLKLVYYAVDYNGIQNFAPVM
jgi:prepilin-type N-terminal cleavage/methylation domain-containing protein